VEEELRKETVVALSRIDALIAKTSRLLELARATEDLPASESIQGDELVGLDTFLKNLAPRLYQGPVPATVWEPPGGAALVSSAGAANRAAWLSAYLAALNGSRAFFSSLLTSSAGGAPTPAGPMASASPREPDTRVERWRKWFENNRVTAVVVFAGVFVVGLAAVTGALKSMYDLVYGEPRQIVIKEVAPGWSLESPFALSSPAEVAEYKTLQLRIMNECASCVRLSDHATAAPDGFLSGPGSVFELDGTRCKAGVRFLISAMKLVDPPPGVMVQPGAPPLTGMRFSQVDVLPGQRVRLHVEGTTNLNVGALACLN
jgi:hypothetical protein